MSTASKKTTKVDKNLCRMITPQFRVSYPHVFKPQAVKPTDKPKYSITMLFDKKTAIIGQSPDGTPRSLKEAIRNAKIAEFGPDQSDWPELESPVTDGDDPKFADKQGYPGHWVVKATTNEDQRPSVIGPDKQPILEASDLYPGCYARAYVYARVWEYMGKRGVQFILDHVQKTRDGESFGGKKSAGEIFSPIEDTDSEEDSELSFK